MMISWFLSTYRYNDPIFFFMIPGEVWTTEVSILGSCCKFMFMADWLSVRRRFFSLLLDLRLFEDLEREKPVDFRFLLDERD